MYSPKALCSLSLNIPEMPETMLVAINRVAERGFGPYVMQILLEHCEKELGMKLSKAEKNHLIQQSIEVLACKVQSID